MIGQGSSGTRSLNHNEAGTTAARAAAQMLLSAGTTIGRTPGRPLPGPLLRCCSPQVRPSVVPPVDHCPGYRSDAAFRRYDHRSYPRQTSARAAAQMLLSAGTTIGRTPGRPLPGPLLRCCSPQVRPSVVPPADHCPGYRSDAALHRYDHRSYPPADHCPGYCSDAALRRYDHRSYPRRPPPGPLLRCRFPQVRPSVVPLEDHCPGYRSDAAFRRYDHRSYPRQTSARAAAQMLLSAGTTIGRTPGRPLPGPLLRCCSPQVRPSVVPPADHCPGYRSDAALHRYDHRSYPR